MSVFDFLKKKPENSEPKYEEIISQREAIKRDISITLKKLNLNEIEIHETLIVIDAAEDKIAKLKESLIGTNINNDPTELQEKVSKEIQDITAQMYVDLKNKVQAIIQRKAK